MSDGVAPAKILVVDDEPANIDLLAAILEDEGEVLFATDGETALTIAELEQPDIVLLDVVLPTIDGYEVCRRLKDNPATSQIPVVFITGRDREADEETGLSIGAVDYLAKPVSAPITRARVRTHIELKRYRDRLADMAYQDGLTGVPNRRRFDEYSMLEWRRARRHCRAMSLLMVDVDQFKEFNDQYGHLEGDSCLKRIATALRKAVNRPGDLLARYGGEEFVGLLPETAGDGARKIADRMREAVEALAIPSATSACSRYVTVSIGVATTVVDVGTPLEELIEAADRNLYRAKGAGRNTVVGP